MKLGYKVQLKYFPEFMLYAATSYDSILSECMTIQIHQNEQYTSIWIFIHMFKFVNGHIQKSEYAN